MGENDVCESLKLSTTCAMASCFLQRSSTQRRGEKRPKFCVCKERARRELGGVSLRMLRFYGSKPRDSAHLKARHLATTFDNAITM